MTRTWYRQVGLWGAALLALAAGINPPRAWGEFFFHPSSNQATNSASGSNNTSNQPSGDTPWKDTTPKDTTPKDTTPKDITVKDKGDHPGGDTHTAPEPISLVSGLVGSGFVGLYALLRR